MEQLREDTRKAVLSNVDPMGQRQDSTQAQLLDLIAVAEKLGMYDASDFLKNNLDLQ